MKFRMICLPNNGSTLVSEISAEEANSIRKNVFFRKGRVSVEDRQDGFSITDDGGQIIISVLKELQ